MIQYLVQMSADPNDKANGGSSAEDRCLWHLGFEDFEALRDKRLVSKYAVQGTLECIQELLNHGAHWRPEDHSQLNSVRQTLYKCEPVVTVELVKLFARHKACPEETLEQLRDVPRMRVHLSRLGTKLCAGSGNKIRQPQWDSRRPV